MEVRCFNTLEEAAFLRTEINALNRLSPRPDPFSTFEFLEHFLKHEKLLRQKMGGLRLWFLTAFEANRLVGYMVLKHTTQVVMGIAAGKLDFLVTHNADRPQLMATAARAEAVSAAFYAYLLKRKSEWGFLEFPQQDDSSALFPPPNAVKLHGYWLRQWPSLDNGTIAVQWTSLNDYFKSFSKKFRSNVSRQMRTLLATGRVEYVKSADPKITPALFELYQSIEPRSWKARAGVNIGRHPHWVSYIRGLLSPNQPMRISIHLILLDGVPIAGLITGDFQKRLYALHIVFDNSLSRLGPGSAILLMSMRQAIDGRYVAFNLLSGFGYYKVRWQAQMTKTNNAQIYRVGSPFFWRRLFGDLKRRLFRPAVFQAGKMLFNPARRDVLDDDTMGVDLNGSTPFLSAQERERVSALIGEIREGKGEFLSHSQLATLMPFATQRSGTAAKETGTKVTAKEKGPKVNTKLNIRPAESVARPASTVPVLARIVQPHR